MCIIFYAPVVEVSRRVSLFFGRQGSVGVGMSAVVCNQSNILICCHKLESEQTFLMAVGGEGKCW